MFIKECTNNILHRIRSGVEEADALAATRLKDTGPVVSDREDNGRCHHHRLLVSNTLRGRHMELALPQHHIDTVENVREINAAAGRPAVDIQWGCVLLHIIATYVYHKYFDEKRASGARMRIGGGFVAASSRGMGVIKKQQRRIET